ncbi:MAG: thioredoxin [Clostridiales bacterium]|nr:thioredoxin [Clostridiales bacterium]
MEETVLHLTKDNFSEKTASGIALVDFWAGWCMPCKMLAPVIDDLAREYAPRGVTVAKVDIDKEMELAGEYAVMSIPTVLIMKDGEEISRYVGVQPKEIYTAALDKMLAGNVGEAAEVVSPVKD